MIVLISRPVLGTHQCDVCCKVLKTQRALSVHMNIHTVEGKRNVETINCDKYKNSEPTKAEADKISSSLLNTTNIGKKSFIYDFTVFFHYLLDSVLN